MDNYNTNPNSSGNNQNHSANFDPEYERFRQFQRNNPSEWQNILQSGNNYGSSQNPSQYYPNSSQNEYNYQQSYPSSQDSYFQPYTIVPETQNLAPEDELEDDACDEVVVRGKKKKAEPKKKGTATEKKIWEDTEDEALISAFMKHSTDAIVSTNQKIPNLWKKVVADYEEARQLRPEEMNERNGNMLRSRWRRMAADVLKWAPTYDAACKRARSGAQGDDDVLKNAKRIYEHQWGEWKFDHAWRLLRKYPKWEKVLSRKDIEGSKVKDLEPKSSGSGKRKMVEGDCATPETPVTDDELVGGASSRPHGIKKAKEMAKGKFKEDLNLTNFATRLQLYGEGAASREELKREKLAFEREKQLKRDAEIAQQYQLEQEKLEWDKQKMKWNALQTLLGMSNLTPEQEQLMAKLIRDVGDFV